MPTQTPIHAVSTPEDWQAAVGNPDGAQLVLAGPGTGKTEFLARRVAHLISTGVAADSILVLTFSRRAASELERRILGLVDRPTSGVAASTFHSFAHRLLETHLARTGDEIPVLLTGPEQVKLVASLLAQEDPEQWPVMFRPLLTSDTLAGEVADFVMRCHERLLDPTDLQALAKGRDDWRALPGFLRTYRQALEARHQIDYATLLSTAHEVATTTDLAQQYGYVVVDEFQDTSPAQARLAERAAGAPANITVAADPHQSIYSFRGADPSNVEEFPHRMGVTSPPTIYLLNRSFRVPEEILESARSLVAANPPTTPAFEIIPAPHRGTVNVYTFDQRSAEAEWIASEVERIHVSEKLPLSSMAVLVRSTRHLLPELSRALERRRLPHNRPDTRLVDHPAIRIVDDIVTAATAAPNASEANLAIRRVLLGPLISLPLGRERELVRLRRRQAMAWPDVLAVEVPEASGLTKLISDPSWASSLPAVDGFWHLWDNLPGVERIVADPHRRDYRAAWSTFARMLERQAERDPSVSLATYLEIASTGDFEASPLLSFSRPDEDRLVVTTLHQAKGLEFEVVFIADAVEGIFPDTRRSRSLLQPERLADPGAVSDRAEGRLSEERRLAYTATTRARNRVVWTATTAGIDEGERRPSRLLLAASGMDNFDSIGPPEPLGDDTEFAPLTATEAEARLRRLAADPGAGTVERLAAVSVLTSSAATWSARFFAGVPQPGPDTGLVGSRLRLSPSQATAYDDCPRRYALERKLRAVEADSPYLLFGSIVHEVLEKAEEEALGQGRQHADHQIALRHLEEVWQREAAFGTPPVNEAWFRRASQLIDQIYSDWPGGDAPAVELEMELNTTLGDVEWVGRADRIDRTPDGIKIVDYKTSKTPTTIKEAARSLQLGYYLLAAAQHPRLVPEGPPTAAELWFPLAGAVRSFDMSQLGEVRDKLIEVSDRIAGEDWTPRVSANCRRCRVKGVCPAWPEGKDAYR